MKYLVFCLFALPLAACDAHAPSSPIPISAQSDVRHAASTTVWQAGSATIGNWERADDGFQCGSPVQTGTTLVMNLTKQGRHCDRNQATALRGTTGELLFLTLGKQYTWTWHEVDGKIDASAPGMGADTYADSLVWEIHGLGERDAPCAQLGFYNDGGQGGQQRWHLTTCSNPSTVWTGTYTPGETDDWKIVATICDNKCPAGASPDTKLYRNGVLQVHDTGWNAHHGTHHKYWWTFGPDKWPWKDASYHGNMTAVNQTFTGMKLTSP